MPNLFCRLLLWAVMVTLLSSGAKAQEPEAFRGIFCQSQVSIERVVVLGQERGGAQEGIIAVNTETPYACFFGSIVGVRGKVVSTIDSPDGILDVVAWRILKVVTIADFENSRLVPIGLDVVEEVIRYTLEESKARGA